VEETLTFYGILYGLPRFLLHERVRSLIEEVGLTSKAGSLVAALSEGMKGRLNLALALVHDPPVLILDEPTHALDPRAKHQLWVVLDRLRTKGKTILLTTHDMDEAEFLSDRVAILDRGKQIAMGTVDALKALLGTTKVVEIRMECQPDSIEEYRTLLQEQNVDCLRGLTIFTGDPQAAVQRLLDHGGRFDQARIVVRNPSLEDVFMKLTGRIFDSEPGEAAPDEMLVHTIA
jgi:ABC-2 type transport system ATP-binding protein